MKNNKYFLIVEKDMIIAKYLRSYYLDLPNHKIIIGAYYIDFNLRTIDYTDKQLAKGLPND